MTIWGDMRGVGVKEKPISSIQDWQITIFLMQSFEIVITMQKDSLLDPVLDLLLDPFLVFLDPLLDLFFTFLPTYL